MKSTFNCIPGFIHALAYDLALLLSYGKYLRLSMEG